VAAPDLAVHRPRLAAPGPSYLRPLEIAPGDTRRVGMSRPQTMADGWWVALLWCEEDGRLVEFADLGPATRPAGSPLQLLGPAIAGLLSGLVLARDGRQQLRLRLGQPPADASRPWEAPLAVLAAFVFEPARVATMSDSELARTVLQAFRDALVRIRD
jgi:hypothetical protein